MHPLLVTIMERRGFTPETWSAFNTSQHYPLEGIDEMCCALDNLRFTSQHIVILPDFDTDGIMSGVVGYAGLRELGFNVSLYYPDPSQGYGFGRDTIDDILAQYPDVDAILTCDVGITCYDGIDYARDLGLTVLVTDHHKENPQRVGDLHAHYVVNPNRDVDPYELKGICGAHVLWQVLDFYARTYVGTVDSITAITRLRVFAGIGTISDMMPLERENRALVRDAVSVCRMLYDDPHGLFTSRLGTSEEYNSAFVGLHTLIHTLVSLGKIRDRHSLTEQLFGFYIAPMFNSIKRMDGDIDLAFDLFFGSDPTVFVDALLELNEQRKNTVAAFYEHLTSVASPYVWVSEASPGILGLLANKKISVTGLPCFVVNAHHTEEGETYYTGSGRAPEWFPAVSILRECEGIEANGHEGAFGIRIWSDHALDRLCAICTAYAESIDPSAYTTDTADLVIAYDGSGDVGVDFSTLSALLDEIELCAPFGKGFPEITVDLVFTPHDCDWRLIGKDKTHVKGEFVNGVTVLAWSCADELDQWQSARRLVARGRLESSEYMGSRSVNIIVDSMRCE